MTRPLLAFLACFLFLQYSSLAGAQPASQPVQSNSNTVKKSAIEPDKMNSKDASLAVLQPILTEKKLDKDVNPLMQLRVLEERVNTLKEKIYKSKANLAALQEGVLGGSIGGTRAVIMHHHDMGRTFKIEKLQYAIDGAPIYSQVDLDGKLFDNRKDIEIYNGSMMPGNHQLVVFIIYRGDGGGVFTYMNSYKFKVKSGYLFNAEEGRQINIRVTGYEKGGITTQLKDKPAVKYDIAYANENSNKLENMKTIEDNQVETQINETESKNN